MNVLGMRAYKRVHDKVSCTRLQNYTIGASLLGIRIRIAKSNISLSDASAYRRIGSIIPYN